MKEIAAPRRLNLQEYSGGNHRAIGLAGIYRELFNKDTS